MSSESTPPRPSEQQELETLRVLLNLPKDVLSHFSPSRPPEQIEQYIQQAPQPELQWLLVDTLHRLRMLNRDQTPTNGRHRNGEVR